ncbi:MAG TPA: LytTR family DNA-binding domain-containing protein [Flavobacteriales bacterium]|nr:LytTR family DNA-binding domain-containing protein [Flavobacteriales bacterium]
MIKAILIDDEQMSRNTLRKLLEMYCPAVNVIAECEDTVQGNTQIKALNPDLVFLDVAMPGQNGVDFLKSLGKINFEVIFVTAHDKYVLQALRFAAVDYLLKPVEERQLMDAVASAENRIKSKKRESNIDTLLYNLQHKTQASDMQLCIPDLQGFQVVQISDIIYCEAENTYTCFFLKNNREIVASRPLIDYETLLEDSSFVRIHKSTLINMKHIKEYQKGEGGVVIMSNDKALDVSRRKKEHFIAKMKEQFKY